MSWARAWETDRPKPEFRLSGLALDHVQFCYRNVCGAGARTKRRAVLNWVKQFAKEVYHR